MKLSELKSIIRECIVESNEAVSPYVEYVKDMAGEEPFEMGGKKFQYVWAKYPNGKRDVGVYSFADDVVYGYTHFRKMYNLNESAGAPIEKRTHFFVNSTDLSLGSRDPDAEREIVYQVVRVTSDLHGDDYYDETVVSRDYYNYDDAKALADQLNRKLAGKTLSEDVEHFSKVTKGTVNVGELDYDYTATVSGNVVGTPQPHGEFYSEIDESSIEIDITEVVPPPTDELWEKVDNAIYDDIMGKNLWDFVNEIQSFTLPKPEAKPKKVINITGKKCVKCKKGTYGEVSVHNDIDGTKTCNACGHTLPTNSTKEDLLK
jgi:hypothetical protein